MTVSVSSSFSHWLPAVLCIVIFLVLLIWLIVRNIRRPVPYNLSLAEQPGDTIFVSVASYRDELCPGTLRKLFERAAAPQNIYVGLCLQNAKGDAPCHLVKVVLLGNQHAGKSSLADSLVQRRPATRAHDDRTVGMPFRSKR